MQQSILLADIDNTLYDWPSFFAPSFRAMVHVLSRELALPEERLYEEFRSVFARHGSLEYAFVVQELESVRSERDERIRHLVGQARGAFNRVRDKHLTPYPGVRETLEWLRRQDVIVIGVTNSPLYRAQHRLFDLKLDGLLDGLIAWEGYETSSNDFSNKGFVPKGYTRIQSRLNKERIWTVVAEECKPSPEHYSRVLDILNLDPTDAWAIGDSKAKDLEPAAKLGIRTIWARYGADLDPENPDANLATLLRITHWSPSHIHTTYNKVDFIPDAIVDTFAEIRLKSIIPERYPTLFGLL